MSSLGHIHTLSLSGCYNVRSVKALGKVHTLDLSYCKNINVDELPALNTVFELDLSGTCLNDASMLGGVHQLKLNFCNITDVRNLGSVHSLNLSGNKRLSDVSPLFSVHTLNVSDCTEIRDVSMLGSVHTLNLSGCYNVGDVSSLGGVHTLCLRRLGSITGVRYLGNVHSLDLLHSNPSAEDVQYLGGNTVLTLSQGYGNSVSHLKNVSDLWIEHMGRVGDLDIAEHHGADELINVNYLRLNHASLNPSQLVSLIKLDLYACRLVNADFSALIHLDALTLVECSGEAYTRLDTLQHVHHIDFTGCTLTSARGLEHCRTLVLARSPNLVDVSTLNHVSTFY